MSADRTRAVGRTNLGISQFAWLAAASVSVHSAALGVEPRSGNTAQPLESGARPAAAEQPRLLVLMVVDQFGRNLLEHHERHLSGGFRRLIDHGRHFRNAVVDHAPTNSLPGHLTVATAAFPRRHGIVDNSWVAVDSPDHERITGFIDAACRAVPPSKVAETSSRGAIGPGRFESPTLVEWALAANPAARFASVGTGGGVAALHAGRAKGPVLWFDAEAGGYVTSTCYAAEIPRWAAVLNSQLARDFMSSDWTLTAPPLMLEHLRGDEASFENGGKDTTFPHSRPPEQDRLARWFVNTPFADLATLALAKAAIEGEDLGRDSVPDVLTVGLSTLDHVGHAFGPFSIEQADVLHRLDGALAEFFTFLDQNVGEGRWAIALTADHGAPPAPEAAHRLAIEGARRLSEQEALAAITAISAAAAKFDDFQSRTRAAAQAAEGLDFIHRVFIVSELERQAASGDAMAKLYAKSFRAGRISRHPLYDNPDGHGPGDYGLIVVPKPYVVVDWAASIHGSPFDYDRQVALLFYGAGVAPGSIEEEARTVDVATTLAALAGLAPSQPVDGRVLDLNDLADR